MRQKDCRAKLTKEGDFWSRRPLLIGLLLLVSSALFLPYAGKKDIHSPDEARLVLIAREMLREGHWFIPHLEGRAMPSKPPVLAWMVAFFSWLGGGEVTEFTAILPVTLSAIAGVIALFLLGEQLFHRRIAFLAALILATTLQYFWTGYYIWYDMPLTLWVTFSFWAFYRGYRFPETRSGSFLLFFLFLALGTSTKGPLGVIIPLLPIACYLLWTREYHIFPAMRPWRGLLIYCLVILPWLLPALLQPKINYGEFIFHQTVVRYVIGYPWERNPPFYFYLPSLLLHLLPWTVFLPGGILYGFQESIGQPCAPLRESIGQPSAALREANGHPCAAFWERSEQKKPFLLVLLWFVSTFLFFSLSAGKRDRYILPLYPATALLVALFWEQAFRAGKNFLEKWSWRIPVFSFVGLAALGGILLLVGEMILQWNLVPKIAFFLPQTPLFILLLTIVLWGGGVLAFFGYRQQKPGWVFGAIWGTMFLVLTLGPAVFFPQYNRSKDVKAFAQEIIPLLPAESHVCGYHFEELPLSFYLDRRIKLIKEDKQLREFLLTQNPAYCFMKRKQYEAIKEELPLNFQIIRAGEIGEESIVLIGKG